MKDFIIRKAMPTDAAALAGLLKQVGRVHAEGRPDIYCSPLTKHDEASALGLIDDEGVGVLVAERDGVVIGELIYRLMHRECDGFYKARKWMYIDDLCVDSSFRGGEVAEALNAEAESIARGEKCQAVELNCWAFNERAARFYTKAGYKPQKTEYEKIL